MKLTDMNVKKDYNKVNRILETRFGFTVDFNSMTLEKAQKLSKSISEAITKIRMSPNIHTSEKNPRYTELLMVREGLNSWTQEKRRLIEGEVGQAEALLAAKDIVDSLQDMMEKVGKIQNEQLPALVDTIRDQIGSEQADTFKSTLGQLLTGISTQLASSRDQADNSVRALTGEGAIMPTGGAGGEIDQSGMPGEFDGEPMPGGTDDFNATDAAAGGNDSAGREMR